jgi:hypothetical protein
VIFSVGVLMVMQVSGALTTQMRYAGARSELAVLVNERLDSIESLPFDSIESGAGTVQDTVTVQGWSYERLLVVAMITPILAKIDITFSPVDNGPSHSVTSYRSDVW